VIAWEKRKKDENVGKRKARTPELRESLGYKTELRHEARGLSFPCLRRMGATAILRVGMPTQKPDDALSLGNETQTRSNWSYNV